MFKRNGLRTGAAIIALIAAGTLAYCSVERLPVGKTLDRYEVVGKVDGSALRGWNRASVYWYGNTMLLTAHLNVSEENIKAFGRSAVLDTQIPDLRKKMAQNQKATAIGAAASLIAAGKSELAQSVFDGAVEGDRNLVFRSREDGGLDLVASLAANYFGSVDLISTPNGSKIYWMANTNRPSDGGDEPRQADVFRSDDQGANWVYDSSVALDRLLKTTTFLNQNRAIALDNSYNSERKVTLRYSQSGAHSWSTIDIQKLVWPDAEAFRGGEDSYTRYSWSLYPVDEDLAVGWSWRTVGSQRDDSNEKTLETRRFDLRFRGNEAPTIKVALNVPTAPRQDPLLRSFKQGKRSYEIVGNRIFAIDKSSLTWHEISQIPSVHGKTPWIVDFWLSNKVWMVHAASDMLFSRRDTLTSYFYSLDQGQTWHSFKLSDEQTAGLAGVDNTRAALLILWRDGDKSELRRYPFE